MPAGFIGPLGVGLALDFAGDNALGWGIAFGHLAVITLTGLLILRRLGTRSLQPAAIAVVADPRHLRFHLSLTSRPADLDKPRRYF